MAWALRSPYVLIMAFVTQHQEGSSLVIEVRWRHRLDFVVVLGMGTFVALVGYIVVTSGAFQAIHKLPLLGSAVAVAYFLLAQTINRTTIVSDASTLVVRHGPLPWWPSRRSIPLEQISKLWCDAQSRRLCLRTKQGQEHELLAALPKPELAALSAMLEGIAIPKAKEPTPTPS